MLGDPRASKHVWFHCTTAVLLNDSTLFLIENILGYRMDGKPASEPDNALWVISSDPRHSSEMLLQKSIRVVNNNVFVLFLST